MSRMVFASLICGAISLVVPAHAATLTGLSRTSFVFEEGGITDTIQFSEGTQITACVRGATVTVRDGNSNTIQFGETNLFTLIGGVYQDFVLVRDIADGTSNTIFVGELESGEFCLTGTQVSDVGGGKVSAGPGTITLLDGDNGFDACFGPVNRTQSVDGSSNTFFFSETFCRVGVTISPNVVINSTTPVPLPAALIFGLTGLGTLAGMRGAWSRRRRA